MENEKTPLHVAFSTQKGGVGKTTFAEQVGADEDYKRMAYEQFTRLGKKAYPVPCSSPEKAIVTADEYVATAGHVPDIVFFDLSGTVNGSTL